MNKISAKFVFGLMALVCACFITCDLHNPVMEKWWPEPEAEEPVTFYTVEFMANGGTPEPGNQKIAEGGKVGKVPAMSKDGFGFGGWYTDAGCTDNNLWNFATDTVAASVADNNGVLILYAKWSNPSFTVSFDTNGGRPKQEPQLIAAGAKIVEPTAIRKAADTDPNTWLGFGGWYTDEDCTDNNLWNFATDTVSVDLTLYAKWTAPPSAAANIEPSYCTVTFYADGGTPQPDRQLLIGGSKIVEPPAMNKDGYGFGGWYADSGLTRLWNFSTDTANADLTLYAMWARPPEEIHYTVTFDAKGGTPPPSPQVLIDGSKIVNPPAMSNGSDGFDGWWYTYAGDGNEYHEYQWNFAMYTVDADLELYAKWSTPAYTVTFNANGGEPQPGEQIIAEGGRIVEPSAMSKTIGDTYYGFGGWYADPGLTRLWNFATDTVNADLTLYARWSEPPVPPAPAHCSVTFDADGGTPEPRPQDITGGSKVVEPYAMSREGYAFGGWYADPGFAKQWDFAADTVSDAQGLSYLTLYAKWVTVYFTVTFEADGGVPAPRDQTVAYGTKAVPPSAMRKPGMGFSGWYSDGALWNFDSPVYSDTVLYASWGDEFFTVMFSIDENLMPSPTSQHGLPVPENQIIADGGKIIEPPDPARTGYCFAGWYTAQFNGEPWDFDLPVTQNDVPNYDDILTLYAYWVPEDPNMVWVRKGSFIMGDDHVTGAKPAHKVTIENGFYIGRYLVTQAEFNSVMFPPPSVEHANHFSTSGNTAPVDSVFWDETVEYCNRLSTTPDLITSNVVTNGQLQAVYSGSGASTTADFSKNGYRLPTEAEWEYAARGGNGSPGNFIYAGSDNPDDVGWYNTNSGSMTRPVGTKLPNGLGIYDMSGNISEWCWDLYDANYYSHSPLVNPGADSSTAAAGTDRVRRGGSWNNAYGNIRTTIRNSFKPAGSRSEFWTLGFRIVRGPLNPPSYTGN